SEQDQRREGEVPEIVGDTTSNHLDDVRGARDPDSKILPIEISNDLFDATDEPFAFLAMDERHNVARLMIVGNQETLPKWAVLGVGKVFRAVRQTAYACHGVDRFDFLRQLSESFKVVFR